MNWKNRNVIQGVLEKLQGEISFQGGRVKVIYDICKNNLFDSEGKIPLFELSFRKHFKEKVETNSLIVFSIYRYFQ